MEKFIGLNEFEKERIKGFNKVLILTISIMNKKIISFLIIIVSLLISISIFNDWENFKRGIHGKPPVEKKGVYN
ncbi:hypothetical protein P872_16850 [Rhodonellum psychrophilum GCM71 = DSM 17998]|uniref:Uncharacterized protein n=1 Tax=Rhodonellum psychrophilum GCM71 = DSM 17998 TaxID=1123057 RepID=U5C2P2_9BACT|nr:hypothetical protein P872_16850 [Rhodonellum psychrophilum GCM71 = DSM 17998]